MQPAIRYLLTWGAAAVLIGAAGCGAKQNGGDSNGLTDNAPARLASEQKQNLRSCALAAAERSYAEQHTGNVTGSLAAVRGALDRPKGSRAKFRARRHDWNLDWTGKQLKELRVRFGTRGLEIEGRAGTPPDVTELYRRLESNRELPDLHLRTVRGNDAEGFEFHFVEKTLRDLAEQTADLDELYTRAREMGVDPVMRDVCPERDTESEPLQRIPDGDWQRVVDDVPGAWRLAGYERTVPTGDSSASAAVYELSKQKSNWDALELMLGDEQLVFRLADLIPDPDHSYRDPNHLPGRLGKLATSRGVESWATFDACPRPRCGLDAAELESVGTSEVKYLTELIRQVDKQRAQLYDLQAASWVAQPVEDGVTCTRQVLDSTDTVSRFSVGLEGKIRVTVPETGDERRVRQTLQNCSEAVVLEKRSDRESDDRMRVDANLDNSDGLHPEILDYEPDWADRDFVDGAEQLRFIAENRKTAEIGRTLETLRTELQKADERLMSRDAFLETVSETLLTPPFSSTKLSPLSRVGLSPGVVYHRIELRADASRQAATQFFALLDGLQDDHLIILENAEWRPGSGSPDMRTTLGVVSRN